MPAAEHNLVIEQGSTFELNLEYQDSNKNILQLAAGFTARLMIRSSHDGDLIFDSDSDTSYMTLANTSPNIKVTAPPSITTNWKARRKCVYDLELTTTASGRIERVIEGAAEITPNVTKVSA